MNVALPVDARGTRTLEFTPDQSFADRQRMALRDLREGWVLARLCWTLSWLDIKLRYRGSVLGPLWLTLSTAVMVGALGFMNSALFSTPIGSYLPFLALSLVLWTFLGSLVSEGCTCFTSSEGMIRSIRMPFTIYGGRVVLRNLLVLAHNVVVIVVVDLALGTWPDGTGLLALPAFALWCVDGLAICLLFGAFCARFRDIPPIVGSVMQMAFFVSAVIYKPEQLGPKEWLLPFNPFFSLLEIVRAPLLSQVPDAATYLSALVYSALICVASWLLFVRVRGRIAFWV
jgi:lipopolysaccharide transport system permease protein